MIVRIWRGETPAEKADEYLDVLRRTGVADYRNTEGNKGVRILRRIADRRAEFVILTTWDSFDSIRRFAGDPVDAARYYEEDKKYLLGFEPTVSHYEVVLDSDDD